MCLTRMPRVAAIASTKRIVSPSAVFRASSVGLKCLPGVSLLPGKEARALCPVTFPCLSYLRRNVSIDLWMMVSGCRSFRSTYLNVWNSACVWTSLLYAVFHACASG